MHIDDPVAVQFRGEEGTLVVTFAADTTRPGWRSMTTLTHGPFTGAIDVAHFLAEAAEVLDGLRAILARSDLTGTLTFYSAEEDVSVTLALRNGKGSMHIRIQPTFAPAGEVCIDYITDQSCLSATAQEITMLLRRFPELRQQATSTVALTLGDGPGQQQPAIG